MTLSDLSSLLLIPALFIFACKDKNQTVQPEIKNITESVYASGLIKSKNQYQVFSKVNGILVKLYVKEGDIVKKGDALFQLNNENALLNTENARLSAANADYAANLGKLEDLKNSILLAEKKCQTDSMLLLRQNNLWKNQVGSKVELEQKELNYENSKTLLASARYKYDDLQKQLKLASGQSKNNLLINKTLEEDLIIRSEVDGKVYTIYREQNELVTNQTPVAVIGADGEYLLELNIDEKDIVRIKNDQLVLIRMDSYSGEEFDGRIVKIDPMMNERTRTFIAEAVFVNRPRILYPNLTAETNIVIQTKQNALTIPRNFLVNDSTVKLENGNLQTVKTGLMDYNLVEIVSGLNSTSKIILPEK